ncbi:MAG: TetR/AcrR family transcriptional regulator [Solirubrobacterales bacterium]
MSDQADPTPTVPLDTVRERPGGRSARIRALVLDVARDELLEGGYGALSHRTVAQRAGVDPATVYRRWPTRSHLATDALLEIARGAVPVPDTGSVESDLAGHLRAIVAALDDPRIRRLFHALSAAGAEADGDLLETLHAFWGTRFAASEEIIARAIERGELPPGADAHAVIEQLVSPAYFRALVTGEPFDAEFTPRCVAHALAAARS